MTYRPTNYERLEAAEREIRQLRELLAEDEARAKRWVAEYLALIEAIPGGLPIGGGCTPLAWVKWAKGKLGYEGPNNATKVTPETVCDYMQQKASEAAEEWDGQDMTDLLKLFAEKTGKSFRDLVMDALFCLQIDDATPVQET